MGFSNNEMIQKEKFYRHRCLLFLLTVIGAVVLLFVAMPIDGIAQNTGSVLFAALASALIWVLFYIQPTTLGKLAVIRLFKNLMLIVAIAAAVLASLIGMIVSLTMDANLFSAAAPIAALATYAIAVFVLLYAEPIFLLKFSPLVPFGITAAALLLSALLSYIGVLKTIFVIAMPIAAIVITIIGFKKEYFSFSLVVYRTSTYTPTTTTAPSAPRIETPDDAMDSVCRKSFGSQQVTGNARLTLEVDYRIAAGTVTFTISGEVFVQHTSQVNMNDVRYQVQRAVNDKKGDIRWYYDRAIDKLKNKGIDISSVRSMQIAVGRIRYC